MNQPNLFGDTIYDALEQLVAALGGNKVVGYNLWPDEGPERAGQHLRDALNPKHRTSLPPDKLMEIFRMAHAKGIHSGMDFWCDDLDYKRTEPVDREQRVVELQKEFIRTVERLDGVAALLKANGVKLEAVKA